MKMPIKIIGINGLMALNQNLWRRYSGII